MEPRWSEPCPARWAPWLNLVLPGAGLILVGSLASGLTTGLVFAACANFAVVAVLLLPDALPRALHLPGVLLVAGVYVSAQLHMRRAARGAGRQAAAGRRAAQLRAVEQRLASGDITGAAEAIRALSALAADDLLVAYRTAEVLTAIGDMSAALEAWQRLRRLDRHGIYRAQTRAATRQLG